MQSIGERLEEARKRKGISLREAAESTKIRSDYLHKFENNQFDIRLPEIYVRGFLRSYSNFLKLPADKIIADYNALSHAEAKGGRTVNREVYGRMDISTTKEKESAAAATGAAPAGAATAAPPDDTSAHPNAPRNPATFVPPPSFKFPIDQKLLVKGAIAVVAAVALIILAVVFFSGSPSKPSEVWIRAQGAEPTITLASKDGPVKLKVTSQPAQGAPLITYFEGTIPLGQSRVIPRRTDIVIECPQPEHLMLTVGTWTGQLTDPKTGQLLNVGFIKKQ